MYVASSIAIKFYGVSDDTLRRWAEDGKLQFKKTQGGHYRFYMETKGTKEKRNICYARVSSRKQSSELENQINFLRERYPSYEILSDVGSGLNSKRPNFKTILEELFKGNIGEVVVASPDRWSRFGADDIFKWIFEKFEGKLSFISEQSKKFEDELTDQLMEVLTVFTSRYYGKRNYKRKDNIESSKENSNEKI